jgi:hypothetical protein
MGAEAKKSLPLIQIDGEKISVDPDEADEFAAASSPPLLEAPN